MSVRKRRVAKLSCHNSHRQDTSVHRRPKPLVQLRSPGSERPPFDFQDYILFTNFLHSETDKLIDNNDHDFDVYDMLLCILPIGFDNIIHTIMDKNGPVSKNNTHATPTVASDFLDSPNVARRDRH